MKNGGEKTIGVMQSRRCTKVSIAAE